MLKKVKLYKFEELNHFVKEVAIRNYINWIVVFCELDNLDEELQEAYNKAQLDDKIQFLDSYIYYYCKDYIIELASNENVKFSWHGGIVEL